MKTLSLSVAVTLALVTVVAPARGETTKLVVKNADDVVHERGLDTVDAQRKHLERTKMFADREHDASYVVNVKPGKNRNHHVEVFQADMKGAIVVAPPQSIS